MRRGWVGHPRLRIGRRLLAVDYVLDLGGDGVFGEIGEVLIGFLFLLEGLLEEIGDFFVAEVLGNGAGGAVAGDLVMFDTLGGADEAGIADGILGVFADEFGALHDEAFHGLAFVAGEFLVEDSGDLLEALDVAFGLIEVFLKAGFEVLVGCGFRHFRQRFDQLIFGAVEVFEFVKKQVFQGFQFHTEEDIGWREADGCAGNG